MDETCNFINECVDTLYGLCPESVNLEDNNIELVLHVSQDDALCRYYFVDHANRTLFWLQRHIDATSDIFCGLEGIHDPSHVGAFCRTYDITGMNYIVIRLCLGG